MKKIKYYHHVCKLNAIKCFIDEIHLCFCTKYQIADCLIFQQESNDCPIKYCYNSGKCIRNVYNARWDFGCVCSGCSYGSLCQLKTSQYALSLDALLGGDILVDVTFVNQTILIKLTFAIVLLMIVIGFISNILSIITFSQGKSREFGSGYYLFCLPIVGQISLIILGGRFCYLLITQLNVVNNFYVVKLTCLALEYLLSVCSALFDWLTCCVGIERTVNMIKGTSFDKRLSVIWSKRLIPIIVIGVCTSLLHEWFVRDLINDPRATRQHTWCIVQFESVFLKYYRFVMNLIHRFVPCSINIIATLYLLNKSAKRKQIFIKITSKNSYLLALKRQILLYGGSFVLLAFGLIRLILPYLFVCIEDEWQ
ncbi:unnamed protein product, partial [Rotaria sordida]